MLTCWEPVTSRHRGNKDGWVVGCGVYSGIAGHLWPCGCIQLQPRHRERETRLCSRAEKADVGATERGVEGSTWT